MVKTQEMVERLDGRGDLGVVKMFGVQEEVEGGLGSYGQGQEFFVL